MSDNNQSLALLLEEANRSETNATCSECGTTESWGLSSWCPCCGYHPRLGTCVGFTGEQQEIETKPQPQTIWELIPEWGWVLAMGTIAIIGLSIGARLYCDSPANLCLWTVSQAALGFVLFLIAQVVVYLRAVSKSAEFGLMSILLTPLKIWRPTIRRLPEGAWKLDMAVWGLALVVSAFAIIGGFEFNSLFNDWGVQKTANVNLLASVVDQAKKSEGGADNLEDAVKNFAGGNEDEQEKEKSLALLPKFDCVVLGYTASINGQIESVILGSSYQEQLVYAGTLYANEIPEETLNAWKTELPRIKQKTPFLNIKRSATWVKPKVTIQVASEGWDEASQQLIKPHFATLLQNISIK